MDEPRECGDIALTAFSAVAEPASDYETAKAVARAQRERPGQVACVCDAEFSDDAGGLVEPAHALPVIALGFGLAVLSQILAIGFLPLAGRQLAPVASHATWPIVALLAGCALASFPASFLIDAAGRRVGFALGASLGVAGGIVMAVAIEQRMFGLLCLGAFWLGLAQGFGLFYRHAAAASLSGHARASRIALVMSAGVLAGLLAPTIMAQAESMALPITFKGAALATAGVQILALAAGGLVSPAPRFRATAGPIVAHAAQWNAVIPATAIACLAWLLMTFAMADVPLAMTGCGLGQSAIVHTVSWHVIAMYVPALVAPMLAKRCGAPILAGCGVSLCLAACVALRVLPYDARFTLGLIAAGTGWSLATTASTIWLHSGAPPSRAILAVHDASLLACALCGALFAGYLQA